MHGNVLYYVFHILIQIKVNAYTFREKPSAIFIYACLFNRGLLLKKRICSCKSKFFSLWLGPFIKDYVIHGTNQEVTKVVSL